METRKCYHSRALRAERHGGRDQRAAGRVDPQEWFNFLSEKAGEVYQTLAGGRGVFRLSRAEVDALKQDIAKAA